MFILLRLEATFLLRGAVAIQPKMAERNAAIEPERRMQFRVGINVGDVVYDDVRIYGEGINVAARLEGIAEAGGICVSGKVYEEISGRFDLAFQDMGVSSSRILRATCECTGFAWTTLRQHRSPSLGFPTSHPSQSSRSRT
jgi:class 3 adenylate cyclase